MSHLRFLGSGLPYIAEADYPGVLITIEGTDGVGRTTQVEMLREWLELRGFGVIETGWTRSQLVGRAIEEAKQAHTLNRLTYSLIYAADFADRLEKEILPALRAGFVVLADRYIFTAFARDLVRGADPTWVRDLFGFAPIPHLVLYLRADISTIVRRVVSRGPIDPFEAGLDIGMGADVYDSFKRYQTMLIREFEKLAGEFGFQTIDANQEYETIQERIREHVSDFFATRPEWDRERRVVD